MIQLSGVSAQTEGAPLTILHNITLHIAEGERVVFTGSSGCGKSSLLKLLLGACRVSEGEYFYRNQAVTLPVLKELRGSAGYIGQESPMGDLSVREFLKSPFEFAVYRDRTYNESKLMVLFEKLHLESDVLDKSPQTLSGGQRQRLNIARVMQLEPAIIFADEPTSALDNQSTQAVVDLLAGSGRTIISVSHDARWIEACDRQLVMNKGRIIDESVINGEGDHVRCG